MRRRFGGLLVVLSVLAGTVGVTVSWVPSAVADVVPVPVPPPPPPPVPPPSPSGGLPTPRPVPVPVLKQAPFVDPPVPVPVPVGVADVAVGLGRGRAGVLPILVGPPVDRGRAGAPGRVRVETLDPKSAGDLGAEWLAFRLNRSDVVKSTGSVEVAIDYSSFRYAFGGEWADRLQLWQKPDCADPKAVSCAAVVVASVNDRVGGVLSATVDVGPVPSAAVAPVDVVGSAGIVGEPEVLAGPTLGSGSTLFLAAGVSGPTAGDYGATPLAASAAWQVGLSSGSFTWSYPIPTPPPVAGVGPNLALSYDSGSIDGMTSESNNQGSSVGAGWDLSGLGFIERRFRTCSLPEDTGDLCWYQDNASLVLNGRSSKLVPTGTADYFRLQDDPGWLVHRVFPGAPNAGNADALGEYWEVITPDGVNYVFGVGFEPNTSPLLYTNSAWAVPVNGYDPAHPCPGSPTPFWCQQAWRWNLDRIIDAKGNVTTIYYNRENSSFAPRRIGGVKPYTRGGTVAAIGYTKQYPNENTPPPARVLFGYDARQPTDYPSNYDCPDPLPTPVPATCTKPQPAFFSKSYLSYVQSDVQNSAGFWVSAGRVNLIHEYPGADSKLWLRYIQRVGTDGNALPSIRTDGATFPNRADAFPGGMPMFRITRIRDELGSDLQVTYGQPAGCIAGAPFTNNTTNCYPSYTTVNGDSNGYGKFNKYVVTDTAVIDTVGGSPTINTHYVYSGAAWRYADDPFSDHNTWSLWRGNRTATVYTGNGTTATCQPSGGTCQTITRHWFFQGMNGDSNGNGTVKTVWVGFGGWAGLATFPDENWLYGREYQSQNMDATNSVERVGDIHSFQSLQPGTATYCTYTSACQIRENASRHRVAQSNGPGGWIENWVDRGYTPVNGLPTTVWERDIFAGASRCTTTTYTPVPPLAQYWKPELPYEVKTETGGCGSGQIASKVQYGYDGQAISANVTVGNQTLVRRFVNASTVLDSTASFDGYGRVTVSTPAGRVATTTTYTPATGWAFNVATSTPIPGGSLTTNTLTDPAVFGAARDVTDANGKHTVLDYDGFGRRISVRRPMDSGNTTTFAYNIPAANPAINPWKLKPPTITTTQTTAGGNVSTVTVLDGLGRTREVQALSPVSGRTVSFTTYDDRGLVARTSAPYPYTITAAPGGAFGDLTNVTSSPTSDVRTSYDTLGRPTAKTTYGNGTAYAATTWGYDGRFQVEYLPGGNTIKGVTARYTDAWGRLASVSEYNKAVAGADQLMATTGYMYSVTDQLTRITDGASNITTYTYDWAGRRLTQSDPDQGNWAYTYEPGGNVATVTDSAGGGGMSPGNNMVSYVYDGIGRRLQTWKGSPGQTLLSFSVYDGPTNQTGYGTPTVGYKGRTYADASMGTAGVGLGQQYTYFYVYDDRGRVSARTTAIPGAETGVAGTYTTSYQYDAADQPTLVGYPDNENVTTAYNTTGQPTTLTSTSANYVTGTSYDSVARVASRVLGGQLTRSYTYGTATAGGSTTVDPLQRLTRLSATMSTVTVGSNVVQDDRYQYDTNGNVTSAVDNRTGATQAECYRYDDRNRLSRAFTTSDLTCAAAIGDNTPANPYDLAYTYSPIGNLLTETATTYTGGGGGGTTVSSAGFETAGNTNGYSAWYGDTIAQTTAAAHTGTGSLAVTVAPGYTNWAVQDSWPGQTNVTAGTIYTFSSWAKAAGAGCSITMNVDWKTSTQAAAGSNTVGTITDASTWQQITATLPAAPANATTAYITFTATGCVAGQVHYIDDITATTGSGGGGGSTTSTRTYTYPASGTARPHGVTSISTTNDAYGYDGNGAVTTRTIGTGPNAGTYTLGWDANHRLVTATKGTAITGMVYGPDGQRLIRTDPDGTRTLYLDRYEKTFSPTGGGSGTIVSSAGFETAGNTNGYTAWYGATIAQTTGTPAHSGTGSLAVTVSAGQTNWGVQDQWPGQTNVIAGTAYTFSSWVKAATTGCPITMNVQWKDSSTATIGTSIIIGTVTSTGTWQQITSAPLTAPLLPTPAMTAYLTFTATGCTAGQTHYIDDINVTTGAGGGSGTTTTTKYYTIGNATVAYRKGTTLYWTTGNNQGSATTATPAAATSLTPPQRYRPYGLTRGAPNQPTDHNYLNQILDPLTGLNYLNNRYYDTTTNRFISVDPFASTSDPQSLNPYTYGLGNPVVYIDPTGLAAGPACLLVLGSINGNCTDTGGPNDQFGGRRYLTPPKSWSNDKKADFYNLKYEEVGWRETLSAGRREYPIMTKIGDMFVIGGVALLTAGLVSAALPGGIAIGGGGIAGGGAGLAVATGVVASGDAVGLVAGGTLAAILSITYNINTSGDDETLQPRDVHGAAGHADDAIDVEMVSERGEMYFQSGPDNSVRIIRFLDKGNGTSDIVIRDVANRSGQPITQFNAPNGYVENKIATGQWWSAS